MENTQNDFFAVMQNENTGKLTENSFSRSSLLSGENVIATAKWQVTPIIVIASIIAFINWILFFVQLSEGSLLYREYGGRGVGYFDFQPVITAWSVFFPIALICTILIIVISVAMKFQEFVITNKRVIAYYGFIRRTAFELKIENVESITIYQSLFARLFGCGMVQVCGLGASKARVFFVKDPFEFRQHFFDLQYTERQNTLD